MFYKNANLKKELVREFIRNNPNTTYRTIKNNLGIKVERLYFTCMRGAYEDAGINPPNRLNIRSKEQKKKIIIDYIKSHPLAGGHTIRKDTKINFLSLFKTTKEAFVAANVKYPRDIEKKIKIEKKKEIVNLVKNNPLITHTEIMKIVHTKFYNHYRKMSEVYHLAGIKQISGIDKRRAKKRLKVIEFIKQNNNATQREINNACKTHVQEIFKEGIFEAYKIAGIKFPFERLKLYGVALKDIKNRAKEFEDKISNKLAKYGTINRFVKTKRGFIDVILGKDNKKVIIEIKDYKHKDISISQIKQLNKYLEDCDCNLGILICHKKPKNSFLKFKDKSIIILEESELYKIPKIMINH